MFAAKVILDSFCSTRIVTVEATYPRFIHSEVKTHGALRTNSASSRAIPWKRFKKGLDAALIQGRYNTGSMTRAQYVENMIPNCMYRMIVDDPVVPIFMGKEQAGMQAGSELEGSDREDTIDDILKHRDVTIDMIERMAARGLHKSICNRYAEPWMWITTLMTATEWNNFFRLRVHPAAERHFEKIARMIKTAIKESEPQILKEGEWHLPYIQNRDKDDVDFALESEGLVVPMEWQNQPWPWVRNEFLKRVSSGRCARLSYLTHDGTRDFREDVRLCNQLINPKSANLDDDVMHATPLEHPNQARNDPNYHFGPYFGWHQFRKDFTRENVPGCTP